MQLKIKRSKVESRGLFGSIGYRLEMLIEFTDEEKRKIVDEKLGYNSLYEVNAPDSIKEIKGKPNMAMSIARGMFPEIRNDTVRVTVNSLMQGQVLEAQTLGSVDKVDSQIRR